MPDLKPFEEQSADHLRLVLRTGQIGLFRLLLLGIVMILVVGAVVFVERGQRRVNVQYAKRVVGRRQYGGTSTHIPLKVNTGGVIPVIFQSSS